MSVQSSSHDQRSARLRDRILAERHHRMVDSAGRRLARELSSLGAGRRPPLDSTTRPPLDRSRLPFLGRGNRAIGGRGK
jgi:hypothetical protein